MSTLQKRIGKTSKKIESLIWATRYPHLPDLSVDLIGQIIREADIAQALAREWYNEVVCGLAREWNKPRIEILKMQPGFLKYLKGFFKTEWARETLLPLIDPRIAEVEGHLAILGKYQSDPDIAAWPKAYRPN